MPRDNSFSDSDQDTPDVRGMPLAGNENFSIIRAVDGHDAYPTSESYNYGGDDPDNDETRPTRRNAHFPNYEEDSLY